MHGLAQAPAWIPAARGKNTPSVRNDLWKRAHLIPSFNTSLKLFMGLPAAVRREARLAASPTPLHRHHHPPNTHTHTHTHTHTTGGALAASHGPGPGDLFVWNTQVLSYQLYTSWSFIYFYLFSYLFIGGEGQRGREKEAWKQALCRQHRAQGGARTRKLRNHDLS